jgi:hypothetical protein
MEYDGNGEELATEIPFSKLDHLTSEVGCPPVATTHSQFCGSRLQELFTETSTACNSMPTELPVQTTAAACHGGMVFRMGRDHRASISMAGIYFPITLW